LGGAGQYGTRLCFAKFFRSLEVDHKLVLGWFLHWQVGRLLALENAVDVLGRAPELVNKVGPIGHQPAGGGERTLIVDSGQFVLSRELGKSVTIDICQWARRDNQAASRGRREFQDGALDLSGITQVDLRHLHPETR